MPHGRIKWVPILECVRCVADQQQPLDSRWPGVRGQVLLSDDRESDANPNKHADEHANPNKHADEYADANKYADEHPDPNEHADQDTNADEYADSQSRVYAGALRVATSSSRAVTH
jgi:hypothetical protein